MNLHTLPAQILTKVILGSLAIASVTNTASTDILTKKFDQIQHFGHYFLLLLLFKEFIVMHGTAVLYISQGKSAVQTVLIN